MEFTNAAIFSSIIFVIYLIMLGLSLYAFVLFVKLARRGIKALDLYIIEKSNTIGWTGDVPIANRGGMPETKIRVI